MSLTRITGTLAFPFGLGVSLGGSIRISHPSFTDDTGTFYPSGFSLALIAADGFYDFSLPSTQGSNPPNVSYTATIFLGGPQKPSLSYLTVPAIPEGASLELWQCRLNLSVPPPPFAIPISQLYSATANLGDVPVFNGVNFVPITFQSTYDFVFTAAQSIVISGGQHGQGTSLVTRLLDSAGYELDASVNVDPFSGDTTFTFNNPQSGRGFIYGGLARSLPNPSKGVINEQTITFKQTEHRINSPNLAVEVYDGDGNLITGQAAINIASNFDVIVTFNTRLTFKVVVVGCLGVAPAPTGGTGGGTVGSVPVPYVAIANGAVVLASIHGKGIDAVPYFFSSDSPAVSVQVDYTRNAAGDIIPDPSFTGTVEISSGTFLGLSAPAMIAINAPTANLTIPATTHGQGPYAVLLCYTNDPVPQAVLPSYTRDATGNIVVSFEPPFVGTVQVNAGGWRGSSLFTQPVRGQSDISIPASVHGQGPFAVAVCFTSDSPAIASSANYTKDQYGNLQFSFAPPFFGLIQVFKPQ